MDAQIQRAPLAASDALALGPGEMALGGIHAAQSVNTVRQLAVGLGLAHEQPWLLTQVSLAQVS